MSVQALVNKRKKNLNHYNVKFGILFISVLQQERLQQSMTVKTVGHLSLTEKLHIVKIVGRQCAVIPRNFANNIGSSEE